MAEREGKEDDRGGTAEVSIILIIYKSVLFRNEKEGEEFFSVSIIIIFALVPLSPFPTENFPRMCETYSLSLSLSLFKIVKDIPPKLQNRKNARDRFVRES